MDHLTQGLCREAVTGLESLSFSDEIQQLVMMPPEMNTGSFTSLLEMPATQAMELFAGDIARFSVVAAEDQNGNFSGESAPSSSTGRVKSEPCETDSSQRLVSYPTAENQNQNQNKRKERGKKVINQINHDSLVNKLLIPLII